MKIKSVIQAEKSTPHPRIRNRQNQMRAAQNIVDPAPGAASCSTCYAPATNRQRRTRDRDKQSRDVDGLENRRAVDPLRPATLQTVCRPSRGRGLGWRRFIVLAMAALSRKCSG